MNSVASVQPRASWAHTDVLVSATGGRVLPHWLYSAALVSVLRFLNIADPGYDLGRQIWAAQNLIAGRGLTWFDHGVDLSAPAHLVTMTHFPAGYSLLAAALFSVGLDVGLTVKLLGAAATMLGWWGWGRLARGFFAQGLSRGGAWYWVAVTIATMTPLLFTLPWGGTDVFLWAAIPWVLEWLVRASDARTRQPLRFDCLAGALCGVAVLIRYASVVILLYAAAIIVWQSRLRIQVLLRRMTLFGIGVLPAFLLQFWINYVVATSVATPGGLSASTAAGASLGRLLESASLLYFANYMWSFWLPGKVSNILFSEQAGPLPWQLALTVIGAVILALTIKTYRATGPDASRDVRVLSLLLVVAIPALLLVCMTIGQWTYVSDLRYYWSVIPLSVLSAYSITAMRGPGIGGRVLNGLRACGGLYIAGYVTLTLVYGVLMLTPLPVGATQREKLMATSVVEWPSFGLVYDLSAARRKALEELTGHPDTLLMASQTGAFRVDPRVDRSKLVGIWCGGSETMRVSGPIDILIVTFDVGPPLEIWNYEGTQLTGALVHADCFERLPNLHLLQRFPDEKLKILEARVDEGHVVTIKP